MFLCVCSVTHQVATEDKVVFEEPTISTLDAFSIKRAREEFETKTEPTKTKRTRFSSDVIVMELCVTVPGEPDALGAIGLTGNTYPALDITNFTKCTSSSATAHPSLEEGHGCPDLPLYNRGLVPDARFQRRRQQPHRPQETLRPQRVRQAQLWPHGGIGRVYV